MQKNTALIFDLGNVIINLKSDESWHKTDLLAHFNAEKLYQLENDLFFNTYETGKISTANFITQLREIAVDADISDEQIKTAWNAILLDIPKHRIELLYQLKKKYNLFLLSNTNDIHLDFILDYLHQHFGKNIFDDIFDFQYYSQKIGWRKPDKEIYELVIKTAQIDPHNAYFFDDKKENLIEPQKLGIHTILVDRDISELTSFLI